MIMPIGISLQLWSQNLVIDFPTDDIPVLSDETMWQEWGDQLVQCDSFANNNSPGTQGYNDWQAWAQAVYYTVLDN